jgi:hypothetical protein
LELPLTRQAALQNQYLPSTRGHRPTLVSEHVKPADKPFRAPAVRHKIDR